MLCQDFHMVITIFNVLQFYTITNSTGFKHTTLALQPEEEHRLSLKIYKRAAERLDSRGRLLLLREMHRVLRSNMPLRAAMMIAAENDDLPCFLYAHDNEAFLARMPMHLAAKHGALSILKYGLRFKRRSEWDESFMWDETILRRLAKCGSVEGLDLVLRALDKDQNLAISIAAEHFILPISAAEGHLACVKFLHLSGCPLWDSLCLAPDALFQPNEIRRWPTTNCLFAAGTSQFGQAMWGVLWYGEMHGAPVPEWFSRERRERAGEVLLCFHGAARLSSGGGEHARLWGTMGNVPLDVLYVILVGAELRPGKGPSG